MMKNIPKVIELVVNRDLCVGCGVCVYKCPTQALEMKWNENGFLIPNLSGVCETEGKCLTVCPFNPTPEREVKTEDELSDLFLSGASHQDNQLGRYEGLYAGYSQEFRLTSSSGGMATFVLSKLLEKGIIDHVIAVQEGKDHCYEYAIINHTQELLTSSKTKYYPVSLSTVFSKINEIEGTFAIVGVACFLKAVRLAQHSDPVLKDKIKFLVGIICGGVKSKFFTEYLASSAGIKPQDISKPEFRIKNIKSTAGDYSFGCLSGEDSQQRTIRMRSVGDMWGTGLFKANACDFCDDVATELADVSLGDAWLAPYITDGRGTNVIITRTSVADNILREGKNAGEIHFEEISKEKIIYSQQGSFKHRRDGLNYRIRRATRNQHLIPPKRLEKCGKISLDYRLVQAWRQKVRKNSLQVWREFPDANIFNEKMRNDLSTLKRVTKTNHLLRAILSKDILNKISRRIKKH